jgi:hypothetical protein
MVLAFNPFNAEKKSKVRPLPMPLARHWGGMYLRGLNERKVIAERSSFDISIHPTNTPTPVTSRMRQLKITKSITNRESQSLDKYLQEIGKEGLINAEMEVELARKIKKG